MSIELLGKEIITTKISNLPQKRKFFQEQIKPKEEKNENLFEICSKYIYVHFIYEIYS